MPSIRTEPFQFEGKRILVTGGCGFIGSALMRRLRELGARAVSVDNLSTGVRQYDIDNVEGDVLRAIDVEFAHPWDLVIHAASVVGQRLAKDSPTLSLVTSVVGTYNVLNQTAGPVMYLSSSAVYGHSEFTREDVDASLADALEYDGNVPGYAVGKFLAEGLVRAASGERPVLVVRPFNVVGPGQTGKYGMVLPRLVAQAKAHGPLTVYGDGSQVRSFAHVDRFVDVLLELIRTPAAWNLEHPVLNVGSGRATEIIDLALEVARQNNNGVAIQHVPYADVFPGHVDVQQRIGDTSRLESLIGPVHWPSVQTIVRELMHGG